MTESSIHTSNFITIKKFISLIVLIFVCASCSTPYQQQNWYSHRGGYSETKLTDNSFRITFNGNKMTDGSKATDYALLRSAEITKLNGFKYFVIATTNTQTMYQETYGGIKEVLGRPSVINIIYCYNNKPLEMDGKIHEASSVIRKIRSKYKIYPKWYQKFASVTDET